MLYTANTLINKQQQLSCLHVDMMIEPSPQCKCVYASAMCLFYVVTAGPCKSDLVRCEGACACDGQRTKAHQALHLFDGQAGRRRGGAADGAVRQSTSGQEDATGNRPSSSSLIFSFSCSSLLYKGQRLLARASIIHNRLFTCSSPPLSLVE